MNSIDVFQQDDGMGAGDFEVGLRALMRLAHEVLRERGLTLRPTLVIADNFEIVCGGLRRFHGRDLAELAYRVRQAKAEQVEQAAREAAEERTVETRGALLQVGWGG